MEYYSVIKDVHVITATLSLLGFLLRGLWMIKESPLLNSKPVKIFPHINDTLLLGAAIYLSIMSRLYPFAEGWLGAKVILLIGYIVAGTFALKRGKTKKVRVIYFIIAVFCISLIFMMALYRPI